METVLGKSRPLWRSNGKITTLFREHTHNEQVPLLEEGGIEAFFKREVLPYVPDAWIDASKTQIGYEISFTRYFYKPVQMRTLDEIIADIRELEKETEGLLAEIVVENKV
jgi:type I restriction enzyme M protein